METKKQEKTIECEKRCPWHGELSVRGRHFKGFVKKIVGQRAVVEWEKVIYYPKYERYAKSRSKVHAHIPKCIMHEIKQGDYIEIGECRRLSKITNFVVLKKETAANQK
jgi:small subunit ribosomal protein S17